MENKFNFNSQICTSREQSERLLALGLRKETADMCLDIESNVSSSELPRAFTLKNRHRIIPAWSLHRLWELGKFMGIHLSSDVAIPNLYEFTIARIERLIKEGDFNKEYMVDQAIIEHCKGVLEYLDYIRGEE